MPKITVHRDQWEKIVEVVHSEVDRPELVSPYRALLLYGVCPLSVISELSSELLDAYLACDGFNRVTTPAEYWSLPAIYVEATQIIQSELKRLGEIKDG